MKQIRSLIRLLLLIVLTGCQLTIAPATETPVPEAVPAIETGEDAVGEMAAQAIVDETYTGPDGRYTNPALGEVELRLDDERLLLDVGEFIVEVRAQTDEAGEVERYVTYNIPLVGLPIEFTENEAGETTFVLGGGAKKQIPCVQNALPSSITLIHQPASLVRPPSPDGRWLS